MISHDRDFLDAVVSHILHIEQGGMKLYTGHYTAFERQRAAKLALQQGDQLIGTCGFKGAPSIDGEVEIGYEIADNYQNRGLATETARALTEFAFAQSGVEKVIAQTLAEENASVRVLKKLGFEFVCAKIDIEDGEIWEWKRGKVLSPES